MGCSEVSAFVQARERGGSGRGVVMGSRLAPCSRAMDGVVPPQDNSSSWGRLTPAHSAITHAIVKHGVSALRGM